MELIAHFLISKTVLYIYAQMVLARGEYASVRVSVCAFVVFETTQYLSRHGNGSTNAHDAQHPTIAAADN